jgi:hypothetical protein
MNNPSMNNPSATQSPDATHLKNVYEKSLAILSESKRKLNSKKPLPQALRSSVPLHIDPVSLQKRALDDAAKALATLWKVSAAGPARSNGTLHFGR